MHKKYNSKMTNINLKYFFKKETLNGHLMVFFLYVGGKKCIGWPLNVSLQLPKINENQAIIQ
jgi:hypothetical protein